jgi:hypothetical protein
MKRMTALVRDMTNAINSNVRGFMEEENVSTEFYTWSRQPGTYITVRDEDDEHSKWNFRTIRARWLNSPNGSIPMADDIKIAGIMLDLIDQLSPEDRYFYLLDKPHPRVLATTCRFGSSSYTGTYFVHCHGCDRYLLLFIEEGSYREKGAVVEYLDRNGVRQIRSTFIDEAYWRCSCLG